MQSKTLYLPAHFINLSLQYILMAILLCIDQGNTLTKACIFKDDKIIANESYESGNASAGISSLIEAHRPSGAIWCSVTQPSEDISSLLQGHVEYVHQLTSQSHLPIMNAYGSPDTLGSDRIALAVAVQHDYPDSNVLAISLGTCITYNFVQKNKAFRGGIISPGMNMRLRAMHEFTGKLPEVAADGDLLLLGYDTETSMRSGAVNGMAAELEGIIEQFNAQYADFNAVLTGGDAPVFANKLKSKIFADPDLLMKGLQLILKHNVPQLH